MYYEVDLVSEVVLLIDAGHRVIDGFKAEGKTFHFSAAPIAFYTYRSLVTPEGYCILCGRPADQAEQHCVSSGGYHAFAGLLEQSGIADNHKAENRSLPFLRISFEEFNFFVESDNLFPAEQIARPITV